MDILLHANSISGSIIGTSEMVSLPGNFSGFLNFYFDAPISVTPGTTYYFQPEVMPGGDNVATYVNPGYDYSGGGGISNGILYPNYDLWFREGIVVPEPSAKNGVLHFLEPVHFVWFRRRWRRPW